jgi:hypothetical protein
VFEWQKFYGEQGDDRGLSGIQTSDGGYAIAGYSNSGASNVSDILFIKTDDNGNAEIDLGRLLINFSISIVIRLNK